MFDNKILLKNICTAQIVSTKAISVQNSQWYTQFGNYTESLIDNHEAEKRSAKIKTDIFNYIYQAVTKAKKHEQKPFMPKKILNKMKICAALKRVHLGRQNWSRGC